MKRKAHLLGNLVGRIWPVGPAPVFGYSAAVLLAVLAQVARLPLDPPTLIPYITFVPFVLLGAALGLVPGLVTTSLCALECWYFAVEPRFSFRIADPQQWAGLGVLFASGLIVSVVFESLRQTSRAFAFANRELAAIHQNAPVVLLVVDEDLRVRKSNDLAAQFAGRPAGNLRGLSHGEAFGCLDALADPAGCGFGPACRQCPLRLAVLDSMQNGTRHDDVEAWLPCSVNGAVEQRCLVISTAPLQFDDARNVLVCAHDVTDRKLAASKLVEQRGQLERQSELINLAHDAIIEMDANRAIRLWNTGAEEMYGWTQAEAERRVIHELLRTTSSVSAEIDRILLRDGRWEGELVHSHRDGRRIVTESRHVLLRDGAGDPAGILEINRDVTERNRVRDELTEANRRTQVILDSISEGFVTFDREWRFTYVNPAAARMMLKRPEEVLSQNLWELFPHAPESPLGLAYRRAMAENIPNHVEAFYPEPLNRWFDVHCYPSPDGLALFFNDTTERKRSEQALRDSEHRLLLAQQVARVGTFEWNIQTGASRWTPEQEKLYGLPPGGFASSHEVFTRLVHPEDLPEVDRLNRESMPAGFGEGEWRAVWPNGTVRWLSARWQVFPDEFGNAHRMVGATIDITASKMAEAALQETVQKLQDSLKERTILLKEVHHRVKNNLAVISSLLGMRADVTANVEAKQALEESQQRVQSIALVHEHLYGTEHLDRVNFGEYARELIDGLCSTFTQGDGRISINVEADPVEFGLHRAVPCALILNELVSNAFKYAFPKGRAGRVDVFCRAIPRDRVFLAVHDDGVGMPEDLDWRMRESLGLQIVQILARQIDATVELVRGSGTRFELTLPRSRQKVPDPAVPDAPVFVC